MDVWLFGRAELRSRRGPVALERKTAALLALLAFEGLVSRARAACLLWPDSAPKTARGNLRQLLRRLRALAREDLVAPGDPLRLRLPLDVRGEGELLAGLDYDDCPELADWLLVQREQCRSSSAAALRAEADRLEAEGELRRALAVAQRLIALQPESEDGHRRIMRLWHRLGDRPAALAAFALCERLSHHLFDAEVSPQTRRLAEQIRRSRFSHAVRTKLGAS